MNKFSFRVRYNTNKNPNSPRIGSTIGAAGASIMRHPKNIKSLINSTKFTSPKSMSRNVKFDQTK